MVELADCLAGEIQSVVSHGIWIRFARHKAGCDGNRFNGFFPKFCLEWQIKTQIILEGLNVHVADAVRGRR